MTSLEQEIDDGEVGELLDEVFESVSQLNTPELDGFSLEFESPPVPEAKSKRQAKVVLAWEEFLSFLKDKPGVWVRVFEFTDNPDETPVTNKAGKVLVAKDRARARSRSINARLKKTSPGEVWEIKAAEDTESESWKVWAQFVRPATHAEVAERKAAHEAAVLRGQNAAAVRASQRSK